MTYVADLITMNHAEEIAGIELAYQRYLTAVSRYGQSVTHLTHSDRIKRVTMPRAWSALYQQDPTADEGTYFSRASFNRYTDCPRRLNFYITADFAVSEDKGDYTDIIVWGVDSLKNCYMVDGWHGQKTVDVWIDALLNLAQRYNPIRFAAEGGVIRRATEPFLKDAMVQRGIFLACEWLTTNADKPALARASRPVRDGQGVFSAERTCRTHH